MPYAGPKAGRREDLGLSAVARVREVAEQRSLLQMQRALTDRDDRRRELDRLQQQLTTAASLEADILGSTGSPGALLTLRMTLGQLAESSRLVRDELHHAQGAADAARSRWEQDKAQLAAVEQLLERRTAERRREARRAEDRQSDETAAQGWLRRTGGGH